MKTLARFLKGITLRQALALLLIACLLHLNETAIKAMSGADPQTPNVSVSPIAPVGTTTVTVDSGAGPVKSIINWQDMNISEQQTLEFVRDGGAFTVLNRDMQSNATQINGTINGNQGHIIIVNQNGIIFGPKSMVTAQKFTAAAMDIDNDEFLNQDGLRFFDAAGQVWNNGTIAAKEQAALVGKEVLNTGTIRTTENDGFVVLAAADEVFLAESKDSDILVRLNMNSIESSASVTNRTERGDYERQSGLIDAPEGTIILAAGDLSVMALDNLGQLRASVDVDAAPPVIAENTGIYDSIENNTEYAGDVYQEGRIHADTENGTAGQILLLAGDTASLGQLSETTAYVTADSGQGGFVELNGEDIQIGWRAYVDTSCPFPQTTVGTFEIQSAHNITIANGERGTSVPENTVYEKDIEWYSLYRMNTIVKSENNITFEALADHCLFGYFGDMIFQAGPEGGVFGNKCDTLHTEKSGDITIIGGKSGIDIGNVSTTVIWDELDAGKIKAITTGGGDISTGYLKTERGRDVEITAVSSGNLAINGIDPDHGASVYARTSRPVESKNTTGKAVITLAAAENIDVASYIYAEANANTKTAGDYLPKTLYIPVEPQPASATAKVQIYSDGATTISLPEEQLVQAVAAVYPDKYYPRLTAAEGVFRQELPPAEIFADASVIICAKGGLTINSDQEYPVQATASTPFDYAHAQSTGVENDEDFGPNNQTHALVCVDCYDEEEEGEIPLLYRPEEPRLSGCPLEMDAASAELGISSDEIHVAIGNSLAFNPTGNPCQACKSLVTAADILRDRDGSRMAAMASVFNQIAPADMPFTPEMGAAIAMAFSENAETDSRYASAIEYVDAFVRYVTLVEQNFGNPTGDALTFAMQKYGNPLIDSGNPNIAAYVTMQLPR